MKTVDHKVNVITSCKKTGFATNPGFSMVELLVAVVILAIGILGVAGLQTTGVRKNQSALQRTQAVYLANQYAEIVRSNPQQEKANFFGDTDADAADQPDFSSKKPPSATAACKTTSGCTSKQLAETALAEWSTEVSQQLPNGIATVSRVDDIYTVVINWADDRSDKNITDFEDFGDDVKSDAAAYLDTGFSMSFQP